MALETERLYVEVYGYVYTQIHAHIVGVAYAGGDVAVYGATLSDCCPRLLLQDWAVVKSWPDVSKKGVLSVAWSPLANSLLVGGGDHNLRVFAPADDTMQE
jgi:hypothetical protein